LDNGAYSCWDQSTNKFDAEKWERTEREWHRLLVWATCQVQKPMWAIVPDRPGSGFVTLEKWRVYAPVVQEHGIPLAVAVQDGMMPRDVKHLDPHPEVVCVGGSTKWKWDTIEQWAASFPRVHLLRCNAPGKLDYLEELGVESTDGTGWNRGDRTQTSGIERWCRKRTNPVTHHELWPYGSRPVEKGQITFA